MKPATIAKLRRSQRGPRSVSPSHPTSAGASAIDAFLSQPGLAPTTRMTYRETLKVLEDVLATRRSPALPWRA